MSKEEDREFRLSMGGNDVLLSEKNFRPRRCSEQEPASYEKEDKSKEGKPEESESKPGVDAPWWNYILFLDTINNTSGIPHPGFVPATTINTRGALRYGFLQATTGDASGVFRSSLFTA